MAPCERSGGINGSQMNRWLGLSPEHHPLFSELTLTPNSEQRLKEALGRLGRARDMTGVFGKRALKDVLGCFEPILALRTPTDKHTGGNTLYAQVAAAYEAYRTGNLDQDAMDAVEAFTEQILFAIAGNTQPPDSSVSSLTYKNELFSGAINATRYETDALGEQALQTLDHVQTLFTTHRHSLPAQHNDQRQFIQARRALPAKVIGALTAMQLALVGCTGGISPTISPTTEATKPAITAPLPTATAEHTKTPTLTLTPTEIPVKATPDSSRYPTTISDQPLTDETLQKRKTDFATLVLSNKTVASEFLTIKTRIANICGNGCTIEGVLNQGRWGVIARNSDGIPLRLQKTKDGGKTWVTMPNASLWELTDKFYSPGKYRLIPLKRPVAVPETATADVITSDGGWWVYVWREETSGNILAWYDAANDQYTTPEGEKLELYAYKPFSEMTSWEECVAEQQQLPWIDDPDFNKALEALRAGDNPRPGGIYYDSTAGLEVYTLNMPSNDPNLGGIIYKYNWNTSSLCQGGYDLVDTCGQLVTPDGRNLTFIRTAVKMVPTNMRNEFGNQYIHLTLVVDPELLKKTWPENYPNVVPIPDLQPIEVQFSRLQTTRPFYFIPFTKNEPIGKEELTNPDTRNIAAIIERNQKNGIQEIFIRALQAKATETELHLLESEIFPVYYAIKEY